MLVVSCYPLGLYLFGGFISHVRFSKFMLWFSGSIKYSSCMCFPTYYSSAEGLNKSRLCKLVLMFMFLWIIASPTYSALPVNAKEVSGDVRFRWKLLFHWLWIFCSYTCSRFFGSELCLLSIFTHSCVYLAFRYSLTKLHGMGVATSWWACTLFLRFIKQVPRLNNSLDIENYHVVVCTSLKFIWSC